MRLVSHSGDEPHPIAEPHGPGLTDEDLDAARELAEGREHERD